MQDVIPLRLWRVGTRDQTIGIKLDRLVTLVDHPLRDREHVLVVDLDHALEPQPLAVVPIKRDRVIRGQPVTFRLPDRPAVGHGDITTARHPAELGVIGLGRVGRRQKVDLGRIGINCLGVLGQCQIVDTTANQIDRPLHARCLDGHPWHGGQGFLARHGLSRGLGQRLLRPTRCRHRRRARRSHLRGAINSSPLPARGRGRGLGLRRALASRNLDEVLEPQQDRDGKNDREDEVTVLDHQLALYLLCPMLAAPDSSHAVMLMRLARVSTCLFGTRSGFGNGVPPGTAPGMTTQQSLETQPRPLDGPMFLHRFHGVA